MKKTLIAILSAIIVLFGGYTALNFGSVTQGNDYYATSTPWDKGQADGQIVKGRGSLGSIVVTSAGDMKLGIYDATSTEVAHFTELGKSTSTVELAVINTATAGTYTFDVNYNYGLYLDVISGTSGTTTITYR